ncbi:transcription factor iwr1 domain-containing protein [Hirsutella rhossiliensis]|uniref:Transcription factor iwr1 domain-containing protein n=1 Tax=Hirsutella rhossiliensis TaxID=111463 RepID=A0A9P8SHQ2_9HYPO|nr:transcription factor iwr1 domain-containing protein [Hirsutella rhossiliensis]KAH0963031.1 transcription factor iwr1 domain-containing protein [Hirsutella rhossiliensis]
MSIPPQLIRVKRKRVEEAPVTFLQFDDGQKRHRSGSNWAYQRRDPASQPAPQASDRPVIHTSHPEDASAPADNLARAHPPLDAAASPIREAGLGLVEPRRFHLSRSTLAAAKGPALNARISKQARSVPTIFVERSRNGKPSKPRMDLAALQVASQDESQVPIPSPAPLDTVERNQLKRPGVVSKSRQLRQDAPVHAPLPTSLTNRHTEDMDKIASDMNRWVLNELGANLHSMEQEKRQAKKPRFKPRAPAQRYIERHPESAPANEPQDVVMDEASEEEGDDDDWIIEEYVRIPANSVALNVSPSDIGVLVLDDDDETLLFFGSMHEDDDDLEDDDDENAENHYTADYPEDEVESDDEYGRQPYCYRNGAASDDEEFDNTICSEGEDNDDLLLGGDGDDDDDETRLARIRAFMQRNSAFG